MGDVLTGYFMGVPGVVGIHKLKQLISKGVRRPRNILFIIVRPFTAK